MLRGRHFGKKDKRKEAKWSISMQNTRLDEEKRQWLHISEFEEMAQCGTTWRNWCLKPALALGQGT